MKRAYKKIIGLFGLLLVVVMTIIAAALPDGLKASAVAGDASDTLQIRVINSTPSAQFIQPSGNIVTTEARQDYEISYNSLTDLLVKVVYTDESGTAHGEVIDCAGYDLDFRAGTLQCVLSMSTIGGDYGKYTLSVYGIGYSGEEINLDSITITWVPIVVSAEQNKDDGLIDAKIDEYEPGVKTVDLYLDGEFLQTVSQDDFDEVIKISLGDRPSGYYELTFIAKNGDGEMLGSPYKRQFYYDANVPEPDNPGDAPDTGGLLQNLNISKTDYLITGLIIFFIVAIGGFALVLKKGKR